MLPAGTDRVLARLTAEDAESLVGLVLESPDLEVAFVEAVGTGRVQEIDYGTPPGYADGVLRLGPDTLLFPEDATWTLAHELDHALDEDLDAVASLVDPVLRREVLNAAVQAEASRPGETGEIVAAALESYLEGEAWAEIAGWNALVGRLRRLGVSRDELLSRMYVTSRHARPYLRVADEAAGPVCLTVAVELDGDGRMELTSQNAAAMRRSTGSRVVS